MFRGKSRLGQFTSDYLSRSLLSVNLLDLRLDAWMIIEPTQFFSQLKPGFIAPLPLRQTFVPLMLYKLLRVDCGPRRNSWRLTSDVEVVDVIEPDKSCSLPNFPYSATGAFGIYRGALFCGGHNSTDYMSECYYLGEEKSWEKLPDMQQKRWGFQSAKKKHLPGQPNYLSTCGYRGGLLIERSWVLSNYFISWTPNVLIGSVLAHSLRKMTWRDSWAAWSKKNKLNKLLN